MVYLEVLHFHISEFDQMQPGEYYFLLKYSCACYFFKSHILYSSKINIHAVFGCISFFVFLNFTKCNLLWKFHHEFSRKHLRVTILANRRMRFQTIFIMDGLTSPLNSQPNIILETANRNVIFRIWLHDEDHREE